ncbi:MAG: phosphodiester glycosidase family protein, partial [Acidobacteria bacterium]|nr:phosphodiester glycosidase family protein [Acidobacteriota bacterium]
IATSTAAAPAAPAQVPARGFVISASGAVPPALARLKRGDRVDVAFTYVTALGTAPADWARADDIIGGAGLLLRNGRAVAQWKEERLAANGFVDARHPRTLIGRDREGDTWLVVIDGRQPGHSAGMTLDELTAFARRLGLVDALNLDGGGSTTMVVKGKIVNRPSDPIGPRPVSDAIVVLNR